MSHAVLVTVHIKPIGRKYGGFPWTYMAENKSDYGVQMRYQGGTFGISPKGSVKFGADQYTHSTLQITDVVDSNGQRRIYNPNIVLVGISTSCCIIM